MLEQEDLSVCVNGNKRKCPNAWSKEMTLVLIGLCKNHDKSTSTTRAYGNTFALRKAHNKYKNSLSSSSLRFLANEAKWKIKKTAKKLVLMAIFQHFLSQTFGKPFSLAITCKANAIGTCPDTIVPRSPSLIVFCLLQIAISCILSFLIRNENSQDTSKRMHP